MRSKTEERRQAIMDAAAQLFQETGYERASMAAISARVGGSKTTIYSYFNSKEELFAAVMMNAMQAQAEQIFGLLNVESTDLEHTFLQFAKAYIEFLLSPGAIAFIRAGMAEGQNSGLGRMLYRLGPRSGLEQMAAFIDRYMKAGRLRADDCWLAALHLKALMEAGLAEPSLYGADIVVDREQAIEAGVRAFLRIYDVM